MSVTPNSFIEPQGINSFQCVVANAKADVVTNANTVLLIPSSAIPNGAFVTSLQAKPRNSCPASALYAFVSPDSGVTTNFVRDALCASFTVTNAAVMPVADWGYSTTAPMYVGPGQSVYVATSVAVANGFVVTAQAQTL